MAAHRGLQPREAFFSNLLTRCEAHVGFRPSSRVLIVGLGSSGLAAALLAARDGSEVWVTDQRGDAELAPTLARLPDGCRRFLGGHPDAAFDAVELVVTSPGVPAASPVLEAARSRGIAVVAELEFAWQHCPSLPLVAVTGSNGKSTVTMLVAEMLKASGVEVVAGGNLGTPASDLVLKGGWSAWVLEVSSFQAEVLTAMRPRVGVFLNLSQDHLERHPSLDAYLAAKRRLFAFQRRGDVAVLCADDPATMATTTRAHRLSFSLEGRADGWLSGSSLMLGEVPLVESERLALSGRHNLANALAAALAARELGASTAAMVDALQRFPGLPHRHRTVHSAGGVRFVDDSKATNVGATLAALGGYGEGSVHLILGGQGKGQDFAPLTAEVRRVAERVYLIGQDRAQIAAALSGRVQCEDCVTLAEAVRRARAAARSGQTVLLAPACASYDQFSGYAERGDVFAALARGDA